ncbi:MAG: MotA/TolQ/ExbB proton channel family protein [Candidatus Omnitrophica bacterium]|nr:MotA/TolQ/ExbB proton channel family protein [Candidatus Omnitrophota bacterium]
MGIWEINLGQLIMAGGPIMVPILICSIIALGVVLGKIAYFRSITTDTVQLKQDVFHLLKQNKIKEAVSLCETNPSPVAKILKAGILKAGSSRETIKEAMEDVSLFEVPKLEKRFTALATIANVSPLLGLLGTVTGMTGAFHTIQARATSMNPVTPADLAGNIWEALITTVAGLAVAIPTFVAYNYLISRVNTFVLEMERAATELVNLLCEHSEHSFTQEEL